MAARVWPELRPAEPDLQLEGATLVWSTGLGVVLSLGGVIWLSAQSNLGLLTGWWSSLLLFLVFRLILGWFDFSDIVNRQDHHFRGAQARLVTWSAALLIGPLALWLDVLAHVLTAALAWRQRPGFSRTYHNWRLFSQLTLTIGRDTLAGLSGLAVYGGTLPLPGLTSGDLVSALSATGVYVGVTLVILLPVFMWQAFTGAYGGSLSFLFQSLRFARAAVLLYVLPAPFGVLLAGLYTQNGPGVYVFFLASVTLLTAFAHQLGHRATRAQQQAQENGQLELLARALLLEPPGTTSLPQLLNEHVPALVGGLPIEVRLFPDQVLISPTRATYTIAAGVWQQMQESGDSPIILRGEPNHAAPANLVLTPIIALDGQQRLGAIGLHVPVGNGYLTDWLPVLSTLSSQIASYLYRAQAYQNVLDSLAQAYREEFLAQAYEAEITLTYQRLTQESALAGKIQTSFLPKAPPDVPGWQFSMTLEPARETSGDFYDIIPLPAGKLGLLVADVADKGMGAALFMALSRTLIRTFAPAHEYDPAAALREANRRILSDTHSDLFVTMFYAVLDPATGLLTYCNAGHNPPLLLEPSAESAPLRLTRTAIPLGIMEGRAWEQATVLIRPGALLVLYTDGITEAQDEAQELFGEERLIKVLQANRGKSAVIIEDKILSAIYGFTGDAPQSDDITLLVVAREQEKG